jgi:hypothetical protein
VGKAAEDPGQHRQHRQTRTAITAQLQKLCLTAPRVTEREHSIRIHDGAPVNKVSNEIWDDVLDYVTAPTLIKLDKPSKYLDFDAPDIAVQLTCKGFNDVYTGLLEHRHSTYHLTDLVHVMTVIHRAPPVFANSVKKKAIMKDRMDEAGVVRNRLHSDPSDPTDSDARS